MLWRWIRGGITVEGLNSLAGFLGLGNPIGWIVTVLLSAGALVVGWFVAAWTWAEGVLEPYGTFGYVSVILIIAILVLIVISIAAFCYERLWLARSARRMTVALSDEPASESVDQGDSISPQYTALLAFFLEHLEPVASAQWSLQEDVLSAGVQNDKVRELATQSLTNAVFYSSFSFVAGRLARSPSQRPTFNELVVSIHNAEFNYQEFIDGTEALASSLGLAIKSDERLFPLWEDWRIKHNELVTVYESIKRDPRFGILFRPLKESRWGKIIPPHTEPSRAGSSRIQSP